MNADESPTASGTNSLSAANALPDTPCYLNGEFSTLRTAKISVLDRGFIFGDGIYEVVPVYGGKLFRTPSSWLTTEPKLG